MSAKQEDGNCEGSEAGFGFFTAAEKERLIRHLMLEELRDQSEASKFKAGEERMDRIEKDLRPLNALYYAVLGSGGVAAMLLATLLYIYSSDKADFKSMQEVLYTQGKVLERLMQSHSNLEYSLTRLDQKLDREVERRSGRQ